MSCYTPLEAWRTEDFSITFREALGVGLSFPLPCGKCMGCRLERSRQWAIRCVHESQMHSENCFITLTYEDNPETLIKEDLQKFWKRLRKKLGKKKIKYFACGEYGDEFKRPHYHAIIFGHDFRNESDNNEVIVHENTDYGDLSTSSLLSEVWGKGFVTVGDVTFDSAAYVARYCTKKINGELAEKHYNGLEPEFATMSKKEAIGKTFYQKYKDEIYPANYVVLNGTKLKVPNYYDKLLEKDDPGLYEAIKEKREEKMLSLDRPQVSDLNRVHKTKYKMNEYYSRALEGTLKHNLYDKKVIEYRKEILKWN
jgi:hypothetical protein